MGGRSPISRGVSEARPLDTLSPWTSRCRDTSRCRGRCEDNLATGYPLVISHSWHSYWKWGFSIAMLVYQSVIKKLGLEVWGFKDSWMVWLLPIGLTGSFLDLTIGLSSHGIGCKICSSQTHMVGSWEIYSTRDNYGSGLPPVLSAVILRLLQSLTITNVLPNCHLVVKNDDDPLEGCPIFWTTTMFAVVWSHVLQSMPGMTALLQQKWIHFAIGSFWGPTLTINKFNMYM